MTATATSALPPTTVRAAVRPSPNRSAGTPPGATRTPTVLRATGALVGVLAVLGALAVGITSAGRTAAVDRLADSTAAVTSATGDADAAFAKADAAANALALPTGRDAAELRYLQALATGVNELERASRLTRLGEPAEAPIRRALRSVGPYGAEVARVSDAATAGTPDRAASARAGAIMTNLIRANTARVGALQDDATRRDASALRRSRWPSLALALLPLVALLVVLVLAQLLLARRFRRLVNVPLLLATLVVVGVAGRTVQLHQRQTDRLDAAVSGPYTAAQRLTNTRVLAYEVEGRRTAGGGAVGAADDAALTATVNDAALAATAHGAALTQALSGYVHPAAVGADASQPGSPASRFNVLDAELLTARSDAQMEFTATIDAARAGQRTTTWLAPVLLAVAAGLAWLGLQRRLAEYR